MIVFANSNIPTSALSALSRYAEVVPFSTSGITYPELSGHADIFMTPLPDSLLVAPNLPQRYKDILHSKGIRFLEGSVNVDATIRGISAYNIATAGPLCIGRPEYLDPLIKSYWPDIVATRQGLCRCSAIAFDPSHVVTSDAGITRTLLRRSINPLLVESSPILLPGYRSGCFGGCCGINGNRLFIIGSLSHHPQGKMIRNYMAQTAVSQIVELYDGPLFDAGSLVFVE